VHVSLNDNEQLLTPPLSSMGCAILADSKQLAEGENMLIRDSPSEVVVVVSTHCKHTFLCKHHIKENLTSD